MKNSVSFFRLMCIYSIDIKKERKNEEENVNDYQCTCIWDNRNVCKWNGIVSTGDKQCRKGDAIIGQMEQNSKGAYLSSGTSVIKDAGTGKIAAGGITQAAQKCNVTVNVIVERLTSGSWARVTSWTAKESNAWSVGTDKTLSVGRGYYYRVRCLHSAHTDASSSMTSSLWR